MNAHAKRWITAIIAGPLVLALIVFGSNWLFALFVALLAVLAAIEFGWMCFGRGARSEIAEGIFLSLVIVTAAYSNREILSGAVTGACILSIIFFLFRHHQSAIEITPLGKSILGFVVIPLLIAHLIMIRNLNQGATWIVLLFLIAVAGDVAAFYIGRTFGKTKLMPSVSPGKTREGAVASAIGSVLIASAYSYYFLPDVPVGHIMILSFLANIFGQLGDLSESLIKRSAGAKDSGTLLPGHGGILDRLDAFLFSTPFVFYYRIFLIE